MKQIFLFVLLVLLIPASNGSAGEVEKNNQIDSLSSIQLGDYSLKFSGESPRKSNDFDSPLSLKSFRKDTFSPFLGLKFSAQLKDDFFKPGPLADIPPR
ncbi:MAG TPA: hypothetical protein VEJ43_16000 [Pseudolabrys sp.]|nr:hypothetical protein [Pseudolabrys sp.]